MFVLNGCHQILSIVAHGERQVAERGRDARKVHQGPMKKNGNAENDVTGDDEEDALEGEQVPNGSDDDTLDIRETFYPGCKELPTSTRLEDLTNSERTRSDTVNKRTSAHTDTQRSTTLVTHRRRVAT